MWTRAVRFGLMLGCLAFAGCAANGQRAVAESPAPARPCEPVPVSAALEPPGQTQSDQVPVPGPQPERPVPAPPPVSAEPARAKSAAKAATAARADPVVVAAKAAKPAAAPEKPAAAPTLDLAALEKRLKDTSAIGVFTKLTLKNQVDDLLQRFRAFYAGSSKATLAELRQPYDSLILKVLTLLQDGDPSLASAIRSSREAIWAILADPVKFSKIAS
jgi:hypothetical protein